jgi:hypothetical protein
MRANSEIVSGFFMLKLYHNTVTRLTAPISLKVHSQAGTVLIAHCDFAARGERNRP